MMKTQCLWIVAAGLVVLAGCADPAPLPPPPPVNGMQDYLAGRLAFESGDDQKARSLLERAVSDNPDLFMAHQMLGDLYRKEDDFRRAGEHYQTFARLDPYDYRSHYDVALAYQFLNRFTEAVTAYLQALALSPRDMKCNMNLGMVYLALGQTDDAVRQLQLAVSIDPMSAEAQCNLGVALETQGKLAKAEACYRRSIELDPAQTVAFVNLGSNLIRQDRGHEAVSVMQEAVKKSDTAQVHKHLGDALVLDHRDDEAMVEYDAALHLDDRFWPAMNQIGMIDVRKYEEGLTLDESLRESALDMWKRSLTFNRNQPRIKELLAKWEQNGKVQP